ncbi:MAG: hypothetical protein CR986_09785 [Ignavibacteriae bacterium]|nr:MAG: hypothetical protein CR986_09785 [Ignavibacteriota bacterium]
MEKLIKITVAIFFIAFISISAQSDDYSKYPGYANFGNLSALEDGEEITEILIEEKLLRMVAKFTQDDEELSDMIGGLKLIKVNTFKVTTNNEQQLIQKAKLIDKDLISKRWDRIVKNKSKDNVTNVYVKTKSDEDFEGLTVVSINKNGEASFVNIVGKINVDALGKLGAKFDIPGVDNIKKNKK